MSEYRVNLDIFPGPLDLLLYLVRKDEVDIYDIPIAKITAQYVEYIELLKMFDLELAGEFLVMAATLMEIKSVMLLPIPEAEGEGDSGGIEDPRAELVRQLLEYKRFKDAANMLQEAGQQRQQRFTRSDYILEKIKPTEEPELDLDQVSIWTLLEAFDGIMKAVGNINMQYDHIKDDTPIDLYQIELLNRLQTDGPITLDKVFEDCRNRLTMIGLFLAMLELIRDRLIWAEQPDVDGPIYLKPLTSEPAEEAVHNAIYASPNAMERSTPETEASDIEVAVDEDVSQADGVDKPDIQELPVLSEDESKTDAEEAKQRPPIRIMDLPTQQGGVQQDSPVKSEAQNVVQD